MSGTTDMSQDIVARLEYLAENTVFLAARPAIREAAEEITSLRARIASLEEIDGDADNQG